MILNYPGGSKVITRVLTGGGGRQEGQRQRRRCAERDREGEEGRVEDRRFYDSGFKNSKSGLPWWSSA